MPIKPRSDLRPGQTEVIFTKVQEIGRAIEGDGDQSLISLFFQAMADDSAEVASGIDSTSVDYQMVTTSGTFRVTVDHEPTVLSERDQKLARRSRSAVKAARHGHNESRAELDSDLDLTFPGETTP